MMPATEIREMLADRLDSMLRRPGMRAVCEADLELRLRELIYDLCRIDEIETEDNPIVAELLAEGLYYPSNAIDGVSNIFQNIMPQAEKFAGEICSVYAKKAYEIGCLDISVFMDPRVFDTLIDRIISGEFSRGYNKELLLEKIPAPSFQAGDTFCYVSEKSKDEWIYFDFSSNYIKGKGRVFYLRSVRWPAETFEDGFELTKEGYENTKRGVACPKFDRETFVREWKAGKIWNPGESMPFVPEEPRMSRWEKLWMADQANPN